MNQYETETAIKANLLKCIKGKFVGQFILIVYFNRYVEPVIKTRVDNQTYYDPYTTIEPEPAVMTPPQHQHYPPPHSEQPNRYSIEQRPDQYYSYRSQDPATERYHPSDPVYTDRQYPVHSYPQVSHH